MLKKKGQTATREIEKQVANRSKGAKVFERQRTESPTAVLQKQEPNRSKGTRAEYLGNRDQVARRSEGLGYSRISEQTARKELEYLGHRKQAARKRP